MPDAHNFQSTAPEMVSVLPRTARDFCHSSPATSRTAASLEFSNSIMRLVKDGVAFTYLQSQRRLDGLLDQAWHGLVKVFPAWAFRP